MTKAEKTALIQELSDKFANSKYFYFTDFTALDAEETTALRRLCYEKGIEIRVIKNKLIQKALDNVSEADYKQIYEYLKGPTAVMFAEVGKVPAQVIKEYRKSSDKLGFKAAFIETDVIGGEGQLDYLTKLKSKEDLLGDLIGLLMAPATNLIGALQSGGQTIHGLLKAIGEKEGAE